MEDLPQGKTMSYFLDDEKKQLDDSLLDEQARKWAQSFVENPRGKPLKTTQMRRFYDELKAIERKIVSGKDEAERELNFKRDKALVTMFKAKAVYAQKRDVSPAEFTQFIFDHVASIKDLKDLKAFLKVFEAVVAFHKFYAKD
ncbi:MAG: type III-A CRISPR-associated protein Csm2 [Thermodesulfobacteriota bacterium]